MRLLKEVTQPPGLRKRNSEQFLPERFVSERFLYLARDDDRSSQSLFLRLFAAVLAFLTDESTSELEENTTASFWSFSMRSLFLRITGDDS